MPVAIDLPVSVGVHDVRADEICGALGGSVLWPGVKSSILHSHHRSNATSFFTECDLDAMAAEGETVRYWWPGKAGKGECNDLRDRNRGCWYGGKLLPKEDELNKCKEEENGDRCLQIKAADGETSHAFTCPSWIRKIDEGNFQADGERCHPPEGTEWQACPLKFAVRRQRLDDPMGGFFWRFKTATWVECSGSDEKDCHGYFNPNKDKDELDVAGYYFDIGMNEWWKCTPWLKCEKANITDISMEDDVEAKCKDCKEGDQCFEIRKFGEKEPKYECVPSWKVNVVSKSLPMAALAGAMCVPKLPDRRNSRPPMPPRPPSVATSAYFFGLFL